MVVSTTSGRPSTEVAVDALLRTVRAEVTAFDGTMAPSWINYDRFHIGSPSSVVRIPSLTSSSLTDIVFSSTTLDTLGRSVEVRTPQGGTTRIQYVGRKETVTGPTGNTRSFTRDELGRVVRSTTFLGVSTTPPIPGLPGGTTIEQTVTDYVYGAFGDLVHLQDQAGNASDFTYDRIGRRILSADPDFGLTRKDYDAFGNVQRMTDAEGRVTTVAVDALGRIVATRSPDGLSCFSWDGSPSSIGQLAADRFVPAVAGEPTGRTGSSTTASTTDPHEPVPRWSRARDRDDLRRERPHGQPALPERLHGALRLHGRRSPRDPHRWWWEADSAGGEAEPPRTDGVRGMVMATSRATRTSRLNPPPARDDHLPHLPDGRASSTSSTSGTPTARFERSATWPIRIGRTSRPTSTIGRSASSAGPERASTSRSPTT